MHSVSPTGRLAPCLLSALLWAPVAGATPASRGPAVAGPDEEFIIHADPVRHPATPLLQPFTVLDGERLLRQDLRNIGEAVDQQLGISSSDFGGNVGRPVIRGLSGARAQVLDNGLGTLDVSTLSPDHAVSVSPLFARQIEVFRGPATLIYGSGVGGGLVNVVDDRIPDFLPARAGGELHAHYDTASEGRAGALKLESALGSNLAVRLEGLKEATESYEIPGFGALDPTPLERRGRLSNSQSDHQNLAAGWSWMGDQGFLGMSVQRMDRRYGVPDGHPPHAEEDPLTEDGGVTIEQGQTRFDVKGEWRAPLRGLRAARVRWGFNDHRHAELEGGGALSTSLANNAYDGRLELLHEPVAGFSGVFGVQLQDRDFSATGEEAFVPDSSARSVAGFVVEEAEFGNVRGELGLRVEYHEAENLVLRQKADFGVQAVSAALTWAGWAGYETGVSLTRAGRAPAIEELFARGPHLATNTYEIGNPALEPEISTQIDFHWRRHVGRWWLNLGLFHHAIDDYIFAAEQDRNGDGVADRVGQDFAQSGNILRDEDALLLVVSAQRDARFWGIELESRLVLLDNARGDLQWRLWSDAVTARFSGGGSIPRIPPLRFGTGLEWRRDAWSAELRATRVTRQSRLAALELPTAGFTELDLVLEYTLALDGDSTAVLFARGSNLLDEDIRRHTSLVKDRAPMPGAGGLLGFRYLF